MREPTYRKLNTPIDKELHQRLVEHAEDEGVTMRSVIEEALKRHLEGKSVPIGGMALLTRREAAGYLYDLLDWMKARMLVEFAFTDGTKTAEGFETIAGLQLASQHFNDHHGDTYVSVVFGSMGLPGVIPGASWQPSVNLP